MSAEANQVITAAEVKQAEQERVSLLATFANRYGLEANNMMRTLRSTVFRPNKDGREPSNEQVAAFLIVANQHNLNPFTKEIHGFLDKWGGIVAVVGIDGWAKKINEHPQFDGMTFEQDDEKCTCTMYRKDRAHPTVHTEWLVECKRPTEPWQTHPKRMLNWKALIQTARIAFGFAGIYEPDEAERIVAAADNDGVIDVTPAEGRVQETNFGPVKISPVKKRQIVQGALKAVGFNEEGVVDPEKEDPDAFRKIWGDLSNAEIELIWKELRSYERSAIKAFQKKIAAVPGLDIAAWSKSLLRECETEQALTQAFKTIAEAYEANGVTEVPEDVVLVCDEMRMSMGAA